MPNTSRVVLVAVLALAVALPAHSQGPTPTPPKVVQQPKGDTTEQKGRPEPVQRTAPSVVISRLPPTTPTDQPEAATRTEHQGNYSSAEWGLVYVTVVLAVVTALLARYTAKLWGATKELAVDAKATADRQAREMQQSLDIGERTVGQMKDTAERQLRAYLVARPGNLIVDDKPQPGRFYLEWHPEIVNTGQTPAYDVYSVARAEIRDVPLPPGTDLIKELGEPTGSGSKGILGHEQSIWPSCGIGRSLSPAELGDLRTQRTGKAWYVWGVVTYRDAFKRTHRTEYCNLADWDSEGNPISQCAPQHNEAD